MHLKQKLNLPENDLILEIGGGGNPHPHSKVLVDRFPDADGFGQRGRIPLVIGKRVMIQSDGGLMPFRNAQFDYVILSHVIEHIPVEAIHQFIGEVRRVASGGYIEAPSIVYEAIRDIPEHCWYVVCEPGLVHLCPKKSVSRWKPFLDPLFEDENFRIAVERYAEIFFTGMEWQTTFEVRIHNDLEELIAMYPSNWAAELVQKNLVLVEQAKERARNKDRVRRYIPPVLLDLRRAVLESFRARWQSNDDDQPMRDWRDLVVCPICHAELKIDMLGRNIECPSCSRRFVIREDGIPSFIF